MEIDLVLAAEIAQDLIVSTTNLLEKRQQLQELASEPSIYRVPEHIRKLSEDAYTPWRISIGPYHHSVSKYKFMEEHKLDYMHTLINRGTNKNERDYIEEVMRLAPQACLCYAEEIELNQREFVQMLVLDGCFIVEFLLRKIRKLANVVNEPTRSPQANYGEMYSSINDQVFNFTRPAQDFIFQSTRTSFEVRRDLILLENQLPYFFLKSLFEFTFEGSEQIEQVPAFSEIVYCALRTSIPTITHILPRDEVIRRFEEREVSHFVSFLKICCEPSHAAEGELQAPGLEFHPVPIREAELPCLCNLNGTDIHEFRVPSVTRLAKAGVEFRSSDNPLLEIQFHRDRGVLVLPVLSVWHHTETFFRNVMAYELYNNTTHGNNRSVSDFMCFMDDLINSKEDVALLVRSNIIQNWLESDETVADLFNSITRHILADYASYSAVCTKLNNFRKTFMPHCKTVLRRDYFNEPWAVIYFITGVVIQTAASVIQAATSVRDNK